MSWSLNEVEGLARKAARGSGQSWGLAEEAGKCVRWLVRRDLPGPELLAELLTRNQNASYETLCPHESSSDWQAKGGSLCPVISGAVLCDHADRIAENSSFALGPVSCPLLLLPFAAGTAEITGRAIKISWSGTSAVMSPDGALHIAQDTTLKTDQADAVKIIAIPASHGSTRPEVSRCEIPQDTAQILESFAKRTYAPDTPESRLAGAGAGLTDND